MTVSWRNIPIALIDTDFGEQKAQSCEKAWLRQLSPDGLESVLHSARMLSLEDSRWDGLTGGYQSPFDPRPLLTKLETESDTATVWHQLWDELHHQGDVGVASYAAVPHIVRIYRKRGVIDWNTYAIVAIIELARTEGKNPGIPDWLASDYYQAIRELAETASVELPHTEEKETIGAMLGIIAIVKGLRAHGRCLVKYSEDELLDVESRARF